MSYAVSVRPAAERDLRRQRPWVQLALEGAILSLEDDPRPPGAIKLSRSSGAWRARITIDGTKWRLIYEIIDPQQSLRVLRITRRNESTYRGVCRIALPRNEQCGAYRERPESPGSLTARQPLASSRRNGATAR